MKTILTTDKANKPFGYLQLDIQGLSSASYANSSSYSNSASYASTTPFAISSSYANNGTQWTTTDFGIEYTNGDVRIESVSNGILVNAYNSNHGDGYYPYTTAEMDSWIAGATYTKSWISPNVNAVSLSTHDGVDRNYYMLSIEGFINIPSSGTYVFGINSDDASDAFIDGIKVCSLYGPNGGPGPDASLRYPIVLSAGLHEIRVRLEETSGGDFVTLYVSNDNWSTRSVVPDSWFKLLKPSKLYNDNWEINSSGSAYFSGSINFDGQLTQNNQPFTASLSTSSSYAITASYALNGGGGTPSVVDIGDISGDYTPNYASGLIQKASLTDTTTIYSPTNGVAGAKLELWLNSYGAARNLSLDSSIIIPSDSAITWPKTLSSGKTYIILLKSPDGSTWWLTSMVGGY